LRKRSKKVSKNDVPEIKEHIEIKKDLNYKINIKFKNEKQKDLFSKILENRITFIRGSSGTGKTLISLKTALYCLKNPEYNIGKILITKPIIESSSSSLGYLKGDIVDKTMPYFESYYDNIEKIIGTDWTKYLRNNDLINESILNFMRGTTFSGIDEKGNHIGYICLIDEAQNTSIKELKLFISRMGEGSKLIIMGDTDQCDLKLSKNDKSGLDDAFDRFKDIPGVSFFEFSEQDIVRDKFLIKIMERYKN